METILLNSYAVAKRFAPHYALGLIVLLLTMIWYPQTGTGMWLRSGYRDEK